MPVQAKPMRVMHLQTVPISGISLQTVPMSVMTLKTVPISYMSMQAVPMSDMPCRPFLRTEPTHGAVECDIPALLEGGVIKVKSYNIVKYLLTDEALSGSKILFNICCVFQISLRSAYFLHPFKHSTLIKY